MLDSNTVEIITGSLSCARGGRERNPGLFDGNTSRYTVASPMWTSLESSFESGFGDGQLQLITVQMQIEHNTTQRCSTSRLCLWRFSRTRACFASSSRLAPPSTVWAGPAVLVC